MNTKPSQGCQTALFFVPLYVTLLLTSLLIGCDSSTTPAPPSSQPSTPGATHAPADLPRTASTFSAAKRSLYEQVYYDHQKTFYCGCDYTKVKGNAGEVDLPSCGVQPRRDPDRAKRLEAEHVFPAAQFGNYRPCWREPEKVCGQPMSGRKCCEQADLVFIAAHNDLFNLFPAEGELNGDRRDYNWGMIPGDQSVYGACIFQIEPSIRRVEPPDAVKGDIARAMFYMSDTYGFNLSRQDQQLFNAWSRQDPPDAWEVERERRIKAIQGRGNRFIEDYSALFGKPAPVPTAADAAATLAPPAPTVPPPAASAETQGFTCGTKTRCSEMTHCQEARFYLTQCGVSSLDRDGDGTPCEKLCK
jgi:deoxyribonuclease-1